MAKLINHENQPIILDYWNGLLPNTVMCKYLYKGYIGFYVLYPELHYRLPYFLALENSINSVKPDLGSNIDYDTLPEILKSFYRVLLITGNTDIPNNEDELRNLIKLLGVKWQHILKEILKRFPNLEVCVKIKPNKTTLISVHPAFMENIKKLANGKIITEFSNGKKNCVATFKNGKIVGTYKQYDRVTGKCTLTKKIKETKKVKVKL